MNNSFARLLKGHYRKIFLLDKHSSWMQYEDQYSPDEDLVLTFDFGMRKHIHDLGGEAHYLDHLVNSEIMHAENFIIYDFFKSWHSNSAGNDIFKFKGIPFGFSFRMEIWNDLVYNSKLYLCLNVLKALHFEKMYLCTSDACLISILDELKFDYVKAECHSSKELSYFFPIAKYMDDRIRPSGIRKFLYKFREVVSAVFGILMPYLDRVTGRSHRKAIFIHEYHPTRALMTQLRDSAEVNVLLANFSRRARLNQNLNERVIPIYGRKGKYERVAQQLMDSFLSERQASLIFTDGSDFSNIIYKIIEQRVIEALIEKLRILDCSISYIDNNKVDLEILIANIGQIPTLFDCVCRQRNIPSYLIINGLLGPEYSDESKYATVINAYSTSIKDNYFRGMGNIVTLGDPRMDMYPPLTVPKMINRDKPTVVIGASGFSPVDLNSYVAIEFDFMHDVLTGLKTIKDTGVELEIVIKVRPNGYSAQYQAFSDKYFPGLVSEIIDNSPMLTVLQRSDLYISINSQTLFEASCLGIPVLYYKNDSETMPPPFDKNSELVTASSVDELVQAIDDFKHSHPRFDAFLSRKIMEQYIGPLDGNNLQRNLDFINAFQD